MIVGDGWAELRIDNQPQRNALTPPILADLRRALDRLAGDGRTRAAVLVGAGGTFSSGFAIDRFPAPEELLPIDDIEFLCEAIEASPLVVVAQIEGLCVGAALDIACACDLRIAAASALLGITPARLGLVYSWRGTERIARVAGTEAARRLFLTGELVTADSEVGRRLVGEVAPDGATLDAAVTTLVNAVAANAPLSLAGTKAVFRALDTRHPLDDDRSGALHALRQAAMASEDCRAAQAAFAERRPVVFRGR